MEGAAGLPGCIVEVPAPACRSAGERIGDENERRYTAMKKTSFSAHSVKRTVCKKSYQPFRSEVQSLLAKHTVFV